MLKNTKGMAMLIVLSLVLMLLILGGAVLMISTGHFGTSYHQIKRAKAYYAAEAAMQHVLWLLRTDQVTPLPYVGKLGNLPHASNFDVNGIKATDIDLTVGDINSSGTDPEGVRPIDIVVNY